MWVFVEEKALVDRIIFDHTTSASASISGSSDVSPTKQKHISEEEYEDVAEEIETKTFNSSEPTTKVPPTQRRKSRQNHRY